MDEMQKRVVYIVTDGCYSDYHIEAVFDTRELAQSYIDRFFGLEYSQPHIDEWNLNEMEPEVRDDRPIYRVQMEWNGDVISVSRDDSSYGLEESRREPIYSRRERILAWVRGESEEHAAKIVNERRTIAIALREQGRKR